MELDKNSLEYWKQMLEKDGLGDIDEAEDFFSEKLISVIIDKKKEVYNEFDLLIDNLEKEYNVKIQLNPRKSTLILSNEQGIEIGRIEKSAFNSVDFSTQEHLMFEIENRFRGKGFGKMFYEIYYKIAKHNSKFFLPSTDYTTKASMINLYKKFGFKPTKKIIKNVEYDLDENDIKEIEQNIESLRKGNLEIRLNYTIKLEKID